MADDPWFDQFDPSQRLPNGGISGGIQTVAAPTGDPAAQATPAPTANPQTWDEASFTARFGRPSTPQELAALEDQLKAAGIELVRSADGTPGKIKLPDGRVIDVIYGAHAGGGRFQWLEPQTGGAPGSPLSSMYAFGSSVAPWNDQFRAPTAEEAMHSPGVEFALAQQNRVMQNNAAAKGISGNYRAQEAIANSLGQSALGQYGDIYGRGMNEYLLRRDNFFQNQDRPWNRYRDLADLGRPR